MNRTNAHAAAPARAAAGLHYDPLTVKLHWITAILVVALWIAGKTIDWFAKGAPRIDARSVHVTLGAALAAVVIARIAWRWRGGRRLPPAQPGLAGAVARGAHGLLYLLLVAVVALGIANAWIRGDDLYGIVTIPSAAPGDLPLRRLVGHLHALVANLILIAAGLHALAGIVHHVVLKDGVLRRMAPARNG